ncbi:MAG: YczE/YyaS/YitT family protein, partial [Ktedonobacteraceae bacterium]
MQFASIRHFNSLAYARRLFVVIFGLFLCSVGIVCTYRSGLGLGPWDVLHKGVSLHTPLSFGQASMLTGALVILVGLMIKIRPGVATILNMLLIGIFIDLQLRSNWLPDLSATQWPLRLFVDLKPPSFKKRGVPVAHPPFPASPRWEQPALGGDRQDFEADALRHGQLRACVEPLRPCFEANAAPHSHVVAVPPSRLAGAAP